MLMGRTVIPVVYGQAWCGEWCPDESSVVDLMNEDILDVILTGTKYQV